MKNFGSHGCIKTKSSPNPYSRIWRTHFLGLNRKGSEKVLIFQCPLEVRMIFLQPVQRTALRNRGKRWPLRVRNRNTTLVATDRIIYNQKPPSCFFPTARGCPFPCTIICLPLCNKAVYLLSCTQPVSSVSVQVPGQLAVGHITFAVQDRPHLFRLCVQYFGQALNIPEKAYDFRAFLGQHGLDHIIRF